MHLLVVVGLSASLSTFSIYTCSVTLLPGEDGEKEDGHGEGGWGGRGLLQGVVHVDS